VTGVEEAAGCAGCLLSGCLGLQQIRPWRSGSYGRDIDQTRHRAGKKGTHPNIEGTRAKLKRSPENRHEARTVLLVPGRSGIFDGRRGRRPGWPAPPAPPERLGFPVALVGTAFDTEEAVLLAEDGDILLYRDAGFQRVANGFDSAVRAVVTGDWDKTYS
jgi:hypothetical protein